MWDVGNNRNGLRSYGKVVAVVRRDAHHDFLLAWRLFTWSYYEYRRPTNVTKGLLLEMKGYKARYKHII